MSSAKKLDLGLQTAYDELFMNEQGRAENRLAKIYDIPLSEIDDFPDVSHRGLEMCRSLNRPSHSLREHIGVCSSSDEILFTVLLNGEPAHLPLPAEGWPYYRWSDFKAAHQ